MIETSKRTGSVETGVGVQTVIYDYMLGKMI